MYHLTPGKENAMIHQQMLGLGALALIIGVSVFKMWRCGLFRL